MKTIKILRTLFQLALLFLLCVSCRSNHNDIDTVQMLSKTRYNTIPSIKEIIEKSKELSEFPDSTFLDTVVPTLIEDTCSMEFFFENRESYYDTQGMRHFVWSKKYTYCDTARTRNNVYTEDIALTGFEEYHILPHEVYEKFPAKFFSCGKLFRGDQILLFVKYYDVDACTYYLLSFDKNYNFLSSMCLYGYTVFDTDKYFEKGVINEKKIRDSFLNHSMNGSHLTLNIKGNYGDYFHYCFKIDNDGFIILYDIIHIDEDGEIVHYSKP